MLTLESFFFFFNDTATTEIYTLSLHDALPIFAEQNKGIHVTKLYVGNLSYGMTDESLLQLFSRSEEHMSELQSRLHLVCRLLLEKKKAKRAHGFIRTGRERQLKSIARLANSTS